MSRGGRFGGGGRGGGSNLPFDVDPALESEIAALRDEDKLADENNRHYPAMKIPQAPPMDDDEKEEIDIMRSILFQRRSVNNPFFLDDIDLGPDDPSKFNIFEDVKTFSNTQKRKRNNKGLPDLRKLPINWELMPPELRYLQYGDDEEAAKDAKRQKVDFSFLNKKVKDPLSKFDENNDGEDDVLNDEDEDVGEKQDEDDDDVPDQELIDDEFEEDEEDDDNDYNAEQYFDGGEDDMDQDEGGMDEWLVDLLLMGLASSPQPEAHLPRTPDSELSIEQVTSSSRMTQNLTLTRFTYSKSGLSTPEDKPEE